MKLRYVLGAIIALPILAVWAVVFMCVCRVRTGRWWMDLGEHK